MYIYIHISRQVARLRRAYNVKLDTPKMKNYYDYYYYYYCWYCYYVYLYIYIYIHTHTYITYIYIYVYVCMYVNNDESPFVEAQGQINT